MCKLLYAVAGILLALPLLGQQTQQESWQDPAYNANAKYIVESVRIAGPGDAPSISNSLQTEIDQVVGHNLDHSLLDRLATRIKDELHVPEVNFSVGKGQMPERVVVTFEVGEREEKAFDIDLVRFLYHSKQGWTGEGGATIRAHGNNLSFSLVSDSDRLAERYAGIQAGYERHSLGTNRLGLRFRFLSYHQMWNRATLDAANPEDIYRTRYHFVPEATLRLAKPLEWDFGVDFARYRIAQPSPVALGPGSPNRSSNAVVSTLRYQQRWGSGPDPYQHEVKASYGIRAATKFLESDTVFARHQADVQYLMKHGHNDLRLKFLAGSISGTAPLYERYVLGNSEVLRGWNKFDLAPLGGSNVVHGSIEYSYRAFVLFWDTGALWDLPQQREQKNSMGVGLESGGFQLAVAFPIRAGAGNPVFYIGMNF